MDATVSTPVSDATAVVAEAAPSVGATSASTVVAAEPDHTGAGLQIIGDATASTTAVQDGAGA